jgi:hypothetical protein
VRTKRGFGGWLALFALGLQLTLSFGHIHAEDLAPATSIAVGAAHGQSGPPSAPDKDHHDGGAPCAIYAVMHLAASSTLPTLPALVVPSFEIVVALIASDRVEVPPAARQPFQARAPPQA